MKIKVGLGVERDAELVNHVRDVVGPATKLMIDANHAYTPTEAITLGRKLEDADLWWFEEPVSCIDVDAYLEVKNRIAIPLAGGETEATRFGFEPWLRRRAFDYCQPDICACGGITEGMKIATLASLTGIHVTPHAWGSAIGQAAALHFYAARSRQPFTLTAERKLIECDRSENPLRSAIVQSPVQFSERDSWMLPKTPGLGVEVIPEAFERVPSRMTSASLGQREVIDSASATVRSGFVEREDPRPPSWGLRSPAILPMPTPGTSSRPRTPRRTADPTRT